MAKGDDKAKRGAGLTREKILAAAVALVDREGLDALTMRALALDLGVEAMSLYRYVTSKNDLLDGLHERILDELVVPDLTGPWREILRELARAFRRVLLAHPHAVVVFATRPAATPASLDLVERVLRTLVTAGFDGDSVAAFQAGISFVIGHTFWRIGTDPPRPSPPAPIDSDTEFEFGLDALLLGLEAKLRRGRSSGRGG